MSTTDFVTLFLAGLLLGGFIGWLGGFFMGSDMANRVWKEEFDRYAKEVSRMLRTVGI